MQNSIGPKILILSPSKTDESLGAMYISSALKKAGFRVKGALIKKDDIFKVFEEFSPDFVLYSVITGEHKECLSLNKKLKKRKKFISVFGGPHATYCPEVISQEGVDAVCIGEGEEAIVEFITRCACGNDITRVRNFWVKKGNRIYRNEPRPLVTSLDSIAFPDRELFSRSRRNKEYTLMASRGCPFDCTYCNNNAFKKIYTAKGGLVRYRSTGNIIQEIKELVKERDVKAINFHDDIFIMDAGKLREFSKRYKKEINIPFICSVRANFISEEIVTLLKEAGCKKAFMGVETANDEVRLNLLKRNITREQMRNAVNLFKKHGITIFTHNIVGLPHTTIRDDLATLQFNIGLKPDFASVTIFMPYPGTELGRLCVKERLVKNFDDIYDTYHYKSPLKVTHRAQISVLHKLFSLTVEYDSLLAQAKALVLNPGKRSFQELREVFIAYREYKYAKVLKPSLKVPEKVRNFLKSLVP